MATSSQSNRKPMPLLLATATMTSRTGTNRLPNDDDDAGGGSSGGGGGDDGDAEGESCGYVDANTVWRAD